MTLRRTEIPKMSAKRRALLAAEGNLNPSSTFRKPKLAIPKGAKDTGPADTGPDKATVDAVLARDGGRCVGCGDWLRGVRGFDYSVHHRKLRSQGGDNRLSNLVSLCGHGTSGCHGHAHSEVAASRLSGFLMLSTEDPECKELEHSQLGRVYLLNDGGFRGC